MSIPVRRATEEVITTAMVMATPTEGTEVMAAGTRAVDIRAVATVVADRIDLVTAT